MKYILIVIAIIVFIGCCKTEEKIVEEEASAYMFGEFFPKFRYTGYTHLRDSLWCRVSVKGDTLIEYYKIDGIFVPKDTLYFNQEGFGGR